MAVEPEEWTEVRGVMDPSPFGDMFTDPNDVFGSTDVRPLIARSAVLSVRLKVLRRCASQPAVP